MIEGALERTLKQVIIYVCVVCYVHVCMCVYMCMCVCGVCVLPVIKSSLLGLIDAFNYHDDSLPGAFQNSQMYQGDHLQSLPLVHTVAGTQQMVRIMWSCTMEEKPKPYFYRAQMPSLSTRTPIRLSLAHRVLGIKVKRQTWKKPIVLLLLRTPYSQPSYSPTASFHC
jgi:hypothetical protein